MPIRLLAGLHSLPLHLAANQSQNTALYAVFFSMTCATVSSGHLPCGLMGSRDILSAFSEASGLSCGPPSYLMTIRGLHVPVAVKDVCEDMATDRREEIHSCCDRAYAPNSGSEAADMSLETTSAVGVTRKIVVRGSFDVATDDAQPQSLRQSHRSVHICRPPSCTLASSARR